MRDFTQKYFHLNSSAVYNSSAKNVEIYINVHYCYLLLQTLTVANSQKAAQFFKPNPCGWMASQFQCGKKSVQPPVPSRHTKNGGQ